jgi:hypothetical protein
MIITLYRNSQTEADNPAELYTEKWALERYAAPTMFHTGKTTAEADFELPSGFSLAAAPKTGIPRIVKNDNWPCRLETGEDGRPLVYVQDKTDPPVMLYRPDETPPAPEKKAEPEPDRAAPADRSPAGYVPQTVDGTWEIF